MQYWYWLALCCWLPAAILPNPICRPSPKCSSKQVTHPKKIKSTNSDCGRQYFEKVPAGLTALSLKTDEGRSIRDDFSQGIDKLVRGAKQAIAAPAQDSQAQEAASRLALEGQQQFLQGQNKFIAAAGREGIKLENK